MRLFTFFTVFFGLVISAFGHDEPTSFIDLRLTATGMETTVTASVTDIAHDLPNLEPDKLLIPEVIADHRQEISDVLVKRLKLTADAENLTKTLDAITPIPEKRDLRLTFITAWDSAPESMKVNALLFPYDPRHRTFVNIYSGDKLLRQEILTASRPNATFETRRQQSSAAVFWEFFRSGIHHIFIGLDHILFVVGLLLLGGGIKQLLKVVTAFTIAHSITLALASFRIITPPASIVEPVIALSIVFVGLHALLGNRRGHDPRIIFAFCFGLVHGFGFANVLQETILPRGAMGLSLFAFNFGVEIAQASIVLAVAPLLALIRHASIRVSDRVVASGALSITAVGAFWFFQRVIG